MFQRVVSGQEPTIIGDVLSQGQLAIYVERVHLDVPIELADDERSLLGETRGIVRRPPIPQIANGVVMAALVVEAMRQLVAGPTRTE